MSSSTVAAAAAPAAPVAACFTATGGVAAAAVGKAEVAVPEAVLSWGPGGAVVLPAAALDDQFSPRLSASDVRPPPVKSGGEK